LSGFRRKFLSDDKTVDTAIASWAAFAKAKRTFAGGTTISEKPSLKPATNFKPGYFLLQE
jgi:hypothetical protein